MAQLTETASRQDLIILRQRTIHAILIDEGINTLRIQEVLDGLTILALPLAVSTTPLVVEGDVHGHAPRVVAEVIIAKTTRRPILILRHTRETGHLHLTAIILAHIGIQTGLFVDGLMQELTTLLGTLVPIVGAAVISPLRPYLVEGGDMVRRIGIALSETIRGKGNQLSLRIYQIHLLRTRLLGTKARESTLTRLWRIFLGLDAVENVLGLSLIVDASIVAPTIRGKDQGRDEIEFTIAGSTLGITRAIRLTTPGEISLAVAILMLHVLLTPAPQTVEDVLLTKLYGNHQTIRHALRTGVVVLHVRDIAHGVAHLEIHLVGATEHIVKHFV